VSASGLKTGHWDVRLSNEIDYIGRRVEAYGSVAIILIIDEVPSSDILATPASKRVLAADSYLGYPRFQPTICVCYQRQNLPEFSNHHRAKKRKARWTVTPTDDMR